MVRRHHRTNREFHFSAAVTVISGNYTAAQRRGVVSGVDFGYAGFVRFIDAAAVTKQLSHGNIVLLSNLGYSAGGELLNCNTYDVAITAAVACGVDKIICMHVEDLDLPEWLSLQAAAVALFGEPEGGAAKVGGESSLRPGEVLDSSLSCEQMQRKAGVANSPPAVEAPSNEGQRSEAQWEHRQLQGEKDGRLAEEAPRSRTLEQVLPLCLASTTPLTSRALPH
jgi:hypothetical protein